MVIERADEADRPAIFRLLEQANMHYIPSAEMEELTYENYSVVRLDEQVVGFCGYKILSPTEAKTELMVVDRSYRGRNIGYLLQVLRMEQMLSQGIVQLTTNSDLPATIDWYVRKFGYRKVGTLKKLHEFGDPTIDHWTTLCVDLNAWDISRKAAMNS
jgi:ribosomal-protein-alanine N-acetyltransferase